MFGAAASEPIPLWVPLVGIAWGALCWFFGGREFFRDREAALRKMAHSRAKSRVVRILGGSGDEEAEYEQLARTAWIAPLVAGGYALGVAYALITAIRDL